MTNALSLKKWCEENISPVAWQRVVMKNLDLLRAQGLGLAELENPKESILLDSELTNAIKKTIQDLYKVELPALTVA